MTLQRANQDIFGSLNELFKEVPPHRVLPADLPPISAATSAKSSDRGSFALWDRVALFSSVCLFIQSRTAYFADPTLGSNLGDLVIWLRGLGAGGLRPVFATPNMRSVKVDLSGAQAT